MRSPSNRTGSSLRIGLSALAIVQIGVLVAWRGGPLYPGPSDGLGRTFDSIELLAGAGTQPLVSQGPTIVLVFHSKCGHCRVVAPLWAEWLKTKRTDLRVVAVSRESLAEAVAYARLHEWDVEVGVTSAGRRFPRDRALTARTPWVFGVDARGVVVASAHGSHLDTVVQAMEELEP